MKSEGAAMDGRGRMAAGGPAHCAMIWAVVAVGWLSTRLAAQEAPSVPRGQSGKSATAKAARPPAAPAEPRTAAEYLARGKDRLASKDYELALADLDRAIRLEPASARLYAARAEIWGARHRRDVEVDDLGTAIRLDPTNVEYLLARGASWSSQGRHAPAMDDFNAAIRLRPADPRPYVARGTEWKRDLKLDMALADYDAAIQVDPRYIPAFVARAMISRQRRDFPRAAAELTAIAEAAPDNAEVHRLLARILATCSDVSVRDGQRAVHEATRACELTGWVDPDSIDTLAAAYAEAGDYPSAVRWQTKAVEMMRKSVTSSLKRSMEFGGRRGVGFEDRLAFYKRKRPARE
jgi:tetratricopeptide (TPR) repeat protein